MLHDYVREYIKAIDKPLPELAETFEKELEFLKQHCDEDHVVLDVGCGAARPAINLSPYVKKIYSIDNNQRMVDLALGRLGDAKNIEVRKENALKTGFPEESFDFVYDTYNLLGSIEKEDRQKLINEMARVVKKGGKITNITWKDDDVTRDFLGRYYPAIGIQITRMNHYTTETSKGVFDRFRREELKEFYEKAGLKNIEFYDIGHVWMAIIGEKT